MTIHFFQPPPEQRVGGLDAAIEGLRAALIAAGLTLDEQLPAETGGHVAHFHGLWQPAHARLSRECVRRGLPYVVSPHGMLEPWAWRHKWWKKWPYFHLVEKRHLAGAAALLATGAAEARRIQRFAPGRRVEALPLGLTGNARPDYRSARQKLGWASEEIVLLYLSRLHVKKGPDLLLRALAGMKWPAVTRLVMVGDGERSFVDALKRFASDHAGALPRIDWVGAVWGDARWKYFQGADLFCLPTHSENFGLAVLDASQTGTPSLTTRETPWADLLCDGRGFIGEPKIASMREQLAQFFTSPRKSDADRERLAEWAWRSFAWETLAPRYVEFYRSLTAGRPPAREPA